MRTNTPGTKAAEVKSKSNPIYDQKLELIRKNKLSKADLLWFLKNIFVSRKTDDAEITMKKQSKAFFQISGAGHEGILSAVAKVLKPKHDYFIPYYRDRALCLGLGVTPLEMLCQANGNVGDTASHGRQMPAHWGNVKLNIVSKSSCTGTQFLQACGIAEAGLHLKKMKLKDTPIYHDHEIVYASCGDGTIAQGEFWEGITTACVNKLPVLFMVEDNGYAISTPVWLNTPGGSISKALGEFSRILRFLPVMEIVRLILTTQWLKWKNICVPEMAQFSFMPTLLVLILTLFLMIIPTIELKMTWLTKPCSMCLILIQSF